MQILLSTSRRLLAVLCVSAAGIVAIDAQTTSFTYQGKLNVGGSPATGAYDMQFKLFDAPVGTGQVGATQTVDNVQAVVGIFTVQLDLGAASFSGGDRFLEISIRPAGEGSFTTLSPRQKLTSAPYSIQALKAALADASTNSLNLGGIAANQFVQTSDPRMTDARMPLAGSNDYIQNSGTPQAGVNLSIGGSASANAFNATTQFNIGGERVLSNTGTNNLFAGVNAGAGNTTGTANAFFGRDAGFANSTGGSNSFFGFNAGRNTTSSNNSFFGDAAGFSNTTGGGSFFGFLAGFRNTTGLANAFFGANSGRENTIGTSNAFFGSSAGQSNLVGNGNAFLGASAGQNNTGSDNSFVGFIAGLNNTGSSNSFFGRGAGLTNTSGGNLTVIGAAADVSATDLRFASAFGSHALVATSDTIVIGKTAGTYNGISRPADTVQIPGTLNVVGTLGANVLNATSQFNLGGQRILSNPGLQNFYAGIDAGVNSLDSSFNNSFVGHAAGMSNVSGSFNTFVGARSGRSNDVGSRNSFFGSESGQSNTGGITNSFFGAFAGPVNTLGNRNAFFGFAAGFSNTTGSTNSFFGTGAGTTTTTGSNNTFIGDNAGSGITTGSNNVFIGAATGIPNPSNQVSNSVAIGTNAVALANNTVVLGTATHSSVIPGKLVTGQSAGVLTTAGGYTETFSAFTQFGIFTGNLILSNLNAPLASPVHLCIRTQFLPPATGGETLARCTSAFSSVNNKTDVKEFSGGLDIIKKLQPVSFKWKSDGTSDLGLNAEDVAEIAPSIVTRGEDGEIKDVKENGLDTLLINAIKQQQRQIEEQAKQIDALRSLVCRSNDQAEVCKKKEQPK